MRLVLGWRAGAVEAVSRRFGVLIDDVRPDESRAVADFLVSVTQEASALFLEGEPGIGKTTLWLAGLDQARERGFVVLSAQAATAESVLAYAALADLLSELDRSWLVIRGESCAARTVLAAVGGCCPVDRHASSSWWAWR
jgi:hypothetical protein